MNIAEQYKPEFNSPLDSRLNVVDQAERERLGGKYWKMGTYQEDTGVTWYLIKGFVDDNLENPANWVDESTYIAIINQALPITYLELMDLIIAKTLIPGRQYKITDYATSNNSFAIVQDINTAAVEEIVVTAIDSDKLSPSAFSPSRPQDTLIFNPLYDSVPDYNNYRDCEYYSDATQNSNGLVIDVNGPNTFTVDTGIVANRDFYFYAEDGAGNTLETSIGYLGIAGGFEWEKIGPSLYQVTLPATFDLTAPGQYIYFGQDGSLGTRTGFITYRKDTSNNIETSFDFVGATMAWYTPDYSGLNFSALATYNKRDICVDGGNLWMSMEDGQTGVTPSSANPWILVYTYAAAWNNNFARINADWDDPFNTHLTPDAATREDLPVFIHTDDNGVSFGAGLSADLKIGKGVWHEMPQMLFVNNQGRNEHAGEFSGNCHGTILAGQVGGNSKLQITSSMFFSGITETNAVSIDTTISRSTFSGLTFRTFRDSCLTGAVMGSSFTTPRNIHTGASILNVKFLASCWSIYSKGLIRDSMFMGTVNTMDIDRLSSIQNSLFRGTVTRYSLSNNSDIRRTEYGTNMQDISYDNTQLLGVIYGPAHKYVNYFDSNLTDTVFGVVTGRGVGTETVFNNATIEDNCDISVGELRDGFDTFLNVTMRNTKIKGKARGNTYSGVFEDNNFLGAITNSQFSGTHKYWNVTGAIIGLVTVGANNNTVIGQLSGTYANGFDNNQVYGTLSTTTLSSFQFNRVYGVVGGGVFQRSSFYNDFYNGLNNPTFADDQVIYNEFRRTPNNTDFSAATLIYANYPTPMKVNSNGIARIRYLDPTDNYVFAAITD